MRRKSAKAKKNSRVAKLLHNMPKKMILCVSECCDNYLRGVTNGKGRDKLYKYRDQIRKLADKNLSVSSKRRLLKQEGGFFLGPLFSALAPIVTGLISTFTGK